MQLTDDNRCAIFGQPERPAICDRFQAGIEMCGDTGAEAIFNLELLERLTA